MKQSTKTEAIIGEIRTFPGETILEPWKLCDGSPLDKYDYPFLFDELGYTFGGSGDSFLLPNLSGPITQIICSF